MLDLPRLQARGGRPLRVAHLTTVDMSLALLLGTELACDVETGLAAYGISAPGPYVERVESLGVRHLPVHELTRSVDPGSDLRAARELAGVIRRLRPDVLHAHNPKTGVLGRILGRALRVPVVVNTCHGLWFAQDDPWRRRTAVLAAEGVASRFSHAELFQNGDDRAALAFALKGRDTTVVGNGVDLTRFRPGVVDRRSARAALGLAEEVVALGGIGRVVAEKGVRELAVAARSLGGDVRVLWAGPHDPAKPDAVTEGLDGVQLLGEMADPRQLYAALDVFVLPSYREGFSRSAMEAAAMGLPLVLTDIRGCREVGRDGVEALLVPPRDPTALAAALQQLVDDPALRASMGAAAAARAVAEFDQREIARQSLLTYARVAERRRLAWVVR